MQKSLILLTITAAFSSVNAYADDNNQIINSPTTKTISTKSSAARDAQNRLTERKPQAQTTPATQTSTNKKAANNQKDVVLQMGAFSNPQLAYRQAAKASLLGVPAQVVNVQKSNGEVVRVVRSSTRFKQADAEKTAADLREQQVNVLLMQ